MITRPRNTKYSQELTSFIGSMYSKAVEVSNVIWSVPPNTFFSSTTKMYLSFFPFDGKITRFMYNYFWRAKWTKLCTTQTIGRVLTNDNGSTTFCKTTLIYLLPKLIDYSSLLFPSQSGIKLCEKVHFLVKLQMVKIKILFNTFWVFAEFEKKNVDFSPFF